MPSAALEEPAGTGHAAYVTPPSTYTHHPIAA